MRAYSVAEIMPKKTGNKFYLRSREEDKSPRWISEYIAVQISLFSHAEVDLHIADRGRYSSEVMAQKYTILMEEI